MKNIRQRSRPQNPRHDDFDWMRSSTPPANSEVKADDKAWRKYCSKIREGWDFAVCMWGAVGRQEEVSIDMPGQRLLVRDVSEHGQVKQIMSEIDWKALPGSWMGAPNTSPDVIIEKYEEKKQEWLRQQRN